jgi:tight adherence protein C
MDLRLLLAIIATLFFGAAFLAGYALLTKRPSLADRLAETRVRRPRLDLLKYLQRSEKFLKPLGEILPRSPEEMSRQERRLVQAGYRRRDAPFLFQGVKIALAIVLFIVFALLGYLKTNILLFILFPVLLGALIPDLWLTRTIASRKLQIQIALPDALDLAVVCVEAGLGLDQSLVRIAQELASVYPALSDEFNLYSLEVNAGRKRADALRSLGQRTQIDDMKSFCAVLIQTDRFGTSVAQSLRVFADSMRTKRRQRAEERAAKMSIKMIPALVFFVFPAILIVIAGPAFIAIIRDLLPGLAGP